MERLKLKESVYILKESEEVYQIIFTGIRKTKKFKVDSLVKTMIERLKSGGTESELINSLKDEYGQENILSCLNSLESKGIVRRYDDEVEQDLRHVKQISFIDELTESWGETIRLQNRLENSTISVFGIGGVVHGL